jgi:hypothetical protein
MSRVRFARFISVFFAILGSFIAAATAVARDMDCQFGSVGFVCCISPRFIGESTAVLAALRSFAPILDDTNHQAPRSARECCHAMNDCGMVHFAT